VLRTRAAVRSMTLRNSRKDAVHFLPQRLQPCAEAKDA
jgi:hypothetical protein